MRLLETISKRPSGRHLESVPGRGKESIPGQHSKEGSFLQNHDKKGQTIFKVPGAESDPKLSTVTTTLTTTID